MADTTIRHRSPFISAASQAIGASAETITEAGQTIPQNTGNIWIFCPSGDSLHWHPTGTPTSSFGHAVAANNWAMLTHAQHGAKIISDDGSDVNCILVYERGAGRQDLSYSITAPF